MKKHLVFISNEIARDKGGIQNLSYYVSSGLAEYFDLTIICSSDSEIDSKISVNVVKTGASSSDFSDFREELVPILFHLHKTKPIDCVLAAQYSICLCCFLLKKIYRVPYLLMGHGNELYGHVGDNKIKSVFLDFLRKKILDFSNGIIANSVYTQNLVNSISINRNVVVIHPPVKCNTAKISANFASPFRLFSISRLVERKGIQLVLKALPDLLEKFPLLHYYIAGSGNYEAELKKITQYLNIERNVTFLGRISEEEKIEQMSKCSLFLMPSYSIPKQHSIEGFGIVYLEANSLGKFVIGGKSGGVPDAIRDNVTGFLVEENSVLSVKQSIEHFFSGNFNYNPEDCREWALMHSPENIVKSYVEFINTLLKNESVYN